MRLHHRSGMTTRDRIREVAVETFSSRGYEKSSLREIADELGITKAALYYHYRSKEELLVSLVEPVLEDMGALLDRLDETIGAADLDPHGKGQLLEDYLDVLLRHRRVCEMFVRDAASMAAMGPLWDQAMSINNRLLVRLSGSKATQADQVRAYAAMQATESALMCSVVLKDVPEEVVKSTLLTTVRGMLGLPTR